MFVSTLYSAALAANPSLADSRKILLQKPLPGFLGKDSKVVFFVTDTAAASDAHPIDVHGILDRGKAAPAYLSAFEYEGGQAEIEDAFTATWAGGTEQRLFVICKWRTLHRGVGTNGYYFKVYVYKDKVAPMQGGGLLLQSDEGLSKRFGSGLDGIQEGEPTSFRFKSAESVLVALPDMARPALAMIPKLVRGLKGQRVPEKWRQSLRELGMPPAAIKELTFNHFADPASKVEVARAETFQEDLDSDGRKEAVSQVLFEGVPEFGKGRSETVFLIHGKSASGDSLLYHRTFSMMKCGYVKGSGMRFTFLKPAKKEGRKILFSLVDVRTCDVGGQEFTTSKDTLDWEKTGFRYAKDAQPKTIDRSGDPDGP